MMNLNTYSRWVIPSLLATLILVSCGPSVSPTSPIPPQASATQNIQTKSESTATVQPTLTVEVIQETAVASPASSCTVLQDLNLRFGPGTAYRPPITALPANSIVTPLGFAPQGIPGGSWAYVEDSATQAKGWVSAGSQFISCNVELSTLPAVAFGTPPPPPLPKSAQNTDPDGNGFCVDLPSEYTCVGSFSDAALFQFQIIKNGIELGENDGVEPVSFVVSRIPADDPLNKVVVYERIENQKPYCVFGGNGPCSSWVIEAGIYKWSPGGTPVEPGEYEMEVNATVNGESSRWAVNFTLTLP
jgi:hypothetical protein